MNQKILNIVYGIAIVLLVGAVVYFAVIRKIEPSNDQPAITNNQSDIVTATPVEPVDLTADWKTYTDSIVGFTFKYPNDTTENITKGTTGLTLGVTIKDLNTMTDMPLGYDKATALKDKAALAIGDPSTNIGMAVKNSFKILNIDGALAKESTILGILEVCDIRFNRQAIIYKDNYQIILSWGYAGSGIQENNPSYFKIDSSVCVLDGESVKMWKDMGIFYADLAAGKTDSVSQNWFTNFDGIIKTFQFTQ
jgi:hypothetical protein